MADDTENDTEVETQGETETFDLGSFVPESFKKEDGSWDTEGFRSQFDELTAFRDSQNDRVAGLPEGPEGYEFKLPEDFKLLEGVDVEALATTDEEGNKIAFDPASMIDPDDPDMPVVQGMFHQMAQGEITPMAAMQQLAGLMVNRELRDVLEAQKFAETEITALGGGERKAARIGAIERSLKAKVPAAQASALIESLTTADAIRGLEALIQKSGKPTIPADKQTNWGEMSIDDRLRAGLQQRKAG